MLSEEDGRFLLRLARETIEKYVKGKDTSKPENYSKELDEKHGVFCTLTKNDQLRGCIGLPYPIKPLIEAVIEAARGSCEDPRFELLGEDELKEIKIEISVLTEPERIEDFSLDKINKEDGLILQYGPYSGLFLPQVWEELPEKERFLDNLCIKAGLSPGMWKHSETKIYKFHVQIFKEE